MPANEASWADICAVLGSRGARAVEGYPMITVPGVDIPWGELHVSDRSSFAAAGFRKVSHPTARRVVMRVDFVGPPKRINDRDGDGPS